MLTFGRLPWKGLFHAGRNKNRIDSSIAAQITIKSTRYVFNLYVTLILLVQYYEVVLRQIKLIQLVLICKRMFLRRCRICCLSNSLFPSCHDA